jgi:hypothetical protein
MRNKTTLLLITLFGVLTFTSCLKDEKEYLPLGAVDLMMIEGLSEDARFLFFEFETEESYPCLNYFIRHESSASGGNIDINLIDIEKSDYCFTALGPAKAEINLGIYQIGTYAAMVQIGEVENTGTLQVTNSQYILTLDDPQMISISIDTLNRIPENLIWGYASYMDDEDIPVVDAFLDSLAQRGANPVSLLPGEFGYFSIDDDENIHLVDEPEWPMSKNFYYQFENPDEDLRDVLKHFYLYHYGDLFAFIRTSGGQIFSSSLP